MRVQLEGQALRLRIKEAELERLLGGETLRNETRWPDGSVTCQQVALAKDHGWERLDDGWRVLLAERPVRELVKRLPGKEGLNLELPVPNGKSLELLFDVDTRDSARRLLKRRRSSAKDES
ncbi:MAG: hypothetical protein L0I62_00430 [Gammaproteobacteria bacterium]|nr:hypothetical protein [Gammaproteobacteria bacterium]